jgi:hypothetical protein
MAAESVDKIDLLAINGFDFSMELVRKFNTCWHIFWPLSGCAEEGLTTHLFHLIE